MGEHFHELKKLARGLGLHTVCVEVTEEFLDFSVLDGNDLVTPHPEWNFPGLKPGDRWCVCVTRWKEAERLYRGKGLDARFKLYPGVGHEISREMQDDINAFFVGATRTGKQP